MAVRNESKVSSLLSRLLKAGLALSSVSRRSRFVKADGLHVINAETTAD